MRGAGDGRGVCGAGGEKKRREDAPEDAREDAPEDAREDAPEGRAAHRGHRLRKLAPCPFGPHRILARCGIGPRRF